MKKWVMRENKRESLPEPNWDRDVHDPFLMKNMRRAAERVVAAIQNNERVIIFGDYDADGVPGAAILHRFFKKIRHENFEEYIPDRYNEEYGLSLKAIDEFALQGVKLIITIDCGTTDVAEVLRASRYGIDVIVADHHIPHDDELPHAYALVNPKQADDHYPFKYLSGAGLAFKLVQAIIKTGFPHLAGQEKWLLDLAALSTVADMVPIVDENRAIVYFGLRVLQKTKNLGLKLLMEHLKINPRYVTEDDIAFLIAPRINAAGRMSHASEAFYLLTTEDEEEARRVIAHLEEKNIERRASVDVILSDIQEKMEPAPSDSRGVMVWGEEDWAVGVLGLTANRLVERYAQPVCLWSVNRAGVVKGSCRSDGTVDLVDLFQAAGGLELFIDYGGHRMSGGFAMQKEKLKELPARINAAYSRIKREKKEQNIIFIDDVLNLDQVNNHTYQMVQKFAPFGRENPKLVFLLQNLEIKSSKLIGNGSLHLQVDFQNSRGKTISATAFFMTYDKFPHIDLSPGRRVDLAANLERTHFRGFPELRLRIVDIKTAL